jgi:hypothetical protein
LPYARICAIAWKAHFHCRGGVSAGTRTVIRFDVTRTIVNYYSARLFVSVLMIAVVPRSILAPHRTARMERCCSLSNIRRASQHRPQRQQISSPSFIRKYMTAVFVLCAWWNVGEVAPTSSRRFVESFGPLRIPGAGDIFQFFLTAP